MKYVTSKVTQICQYSFTSKNIDSTIENLNIGIRWDVVHSNHLKYSGKLFRLFIRCCLIDLFLMDLSQNKWCEFKSIVKNKAVSKSSSDNYRPIMNSTNIFNLFKYCSFPICRRFF